MRPGTLIVDATFLKHLASAESIRCLESACRVAHLEVWPSVINVLEALKHPNAASREHLVAAIERWTHGKPLLPWPPQLLHLAGAAAEVGDYDFVVRGPDLPYLTTDRDRLQDDHAAATRFVLGAEERFRQAHQRARKDVQATLKRQGLRDAWPDLPTFLDQEWGDAGSREHLIGLLWRQVDLPGMPPADLAQRSEPWRLAVDALGSATYDTTVRKEQQGNAPGLLDLLQLTYLSLHRRSRIFITDDGALFEAANAILCGRYPNVRVMRGGEFLALAA